MCVAIGAPGRLLTGRVKKKEEEALLTGVRGLAYHANTELQKDGGSERSDVVGSLHRLSLVSEWGA